MGKYMKRAEKESIDRQVENEALNNFQGEVFDTMDFVLTKAIIKSRILEERGYSLEQYRKA